MHLPAKVNSLSVQTFMANKSLSDSDSDGGIFIHKDCLQGYALLLSSLVLYTAFITTKD